MKSKNLTSALPAAVFAVGAIIAGSTSAVKAEEVVIASYGGSFQDAQTSALFDPYAEASGVTVTGTTGSGYAKVKAMVESGNITWDVVSAESSAFANEQKDGLLQPIDYSIVQADGIPAEFRKEYGVGYITFGMNVAWSNDKFPDGVTPAQFFDPEVKGRRAVPAEPEYMLEFALLADGVPAGELYPLDVERALSVIDRVKDQIVAFKGASDTQALIQQGEVDMAYIPNGRVKNAIDAGANWAYGWDASVSDTEWWVVVKGAPNAEEAMKFINFASQPEQQAELTRQIPYGPTNTAALDLLDDAVAMDLPSHPENAAKGAVLDSAWWNDNRETVKERWATYILE